MLHQVSYIQGINTNISKMSEAFYSHVLDAWNLNTDYAEGYGLIDRQYTTGEYYPAIWRADSNKDYTKVLHEDNRALTFFVGVAESSTKQTNFYQVAAHLIVMLNYTMLPINSLHTPFVEVDKVMCDWLEVPRFGFKLTSKSMGVDSCFAEYSGARKSDEYRQLDKLPFGCFRYNFDLKYK